jgi:hypothetical protein
MIFDQAFNVRNISKILKFGDMHCIIGYNNYCSNDVHCGWWCPGGSAV